MALTQLRTTLRYRHQDVVFADVYIRSIKTWTKPAPGVGTGIAPLVTRYVCRCLQLLCECPHALPVSAPRRRRSESACARCDVARSACKARLPELDEDRRRDQPPIRIASSSSSSLSEPPQPDFPVDGTWRQTMVRWVCGVRENDNIRRWCDGCVESGRTITSDDGAMGVWSQGER